MRVQRRGPGWVPTIAALLGVALTLSAAYWQYGRAEYKARLAAEFSRRQSAPVIRLSERLPGLEEMRFRKVEASGEFAGGRTIYLDNRVRGGVAGYEVVTPLKLSASGRYLLVDRGWTARARERSVVPQVDIPVGRVTVRGTAIVPSEKVYELSGATVEGRIWQNLVLSRYRESQQLDILDFVLEQEDDAGDGLLRRWNAPDFGVSTHRSYVVQWLLFASLIVFFYVYYGFIRSKRVSPQ